MSALAARLEEEILAAPTRALPASPATMHEVARVDPSAMLDHAMLVHARDLAETWSVSAAAHSRLAQAELVAGNLDEALNAARHAVRFGIDTSDSASIAAAAQVLAQLGEYEEAERAVENLSEKGSTSYARAAIAVGRGDKTRALAYLQRATDTASLSLRGWLHLQRQQYAKAISDFRAILKEGVANPDVLINLGYAYGALGLVDKAILFTKEAVHLAPLNRTAGLNLVNYLVGREEFDSALKLLRDFQTAYPADQNIGAAVAEVLWKSGNPDSALRELRRAVARAEEFDASPSARAELGASLAYLRWQRGEIPKPAVVERIRKELLRCDYKSLSTGRLLVNVFTAPSDADQLALVRNGLSRWHDDDELLPFTTQLLYLRGRFDASLEAAMRWTRVDPFEADAVIRATYLLCDFKNDYDAAIQMGMAFLRRGTVRSVIANNVAYALTLSRRPTEARKVLEGIEDRPHVKATRGLICLAEGDYEGGYQLYEDAATSDLVPADPLLADIIKARFVLAALQFGYRNVDKTPLNALRRSDDPRAVVLANMARKLGIELA